MGPLYLAHFGRKYPLLTTAYASVRLRSGAQFSSQTTLKYKGPNPTEDINVLRTMSAGYMLKIYKNA